MWKTFLLLLSSSLLCAAPPKVVVFDYGGVIATVNREEILHFLSTTLGVPYEKVKKDFSGEELYIAFNKPFYYWVEYSNQPIKQEWFESLEAQKRKMIRPIPGMEEILLQLRAQGYRVALLSNTNKYRARFLESMGGYRYFDPVLLSCYLGVSKPDPKIYEKLLYNLNEAPENCLFIDNKPANIETAQKFKMQGIVFQSVSQLRADLSKVEVELNP